MAELVAAELTRVARRLDRQSPGNVDLVDAGAGGGEPWLVCWRRRSPPWWRVPGPRPSTSGRHQMATWPVSGCAGGGWHSQLGRPACRAGPATVRWRRGDASVECPPTRGLIVAHELLDDVPYDVAVLRHEGWRYLAVDLAGDEVVDGPVEPSDASWLQRWAGDARLADRVEIGRPRDEIAVALASHLTCGRLIIIDYATSADQRRRLHPDGTLTGYRNGHQCRPRPDGTMNLTAHVAIDSVVEAPPRSVMSGWARWQMRPIGTLPNRTARPLDPTAGTVHRCCPSRSACAGPAGRDRGSWGGFRVALLGPLGYRRYLSQSRSCWAPGCAAGGSSG